MQRGSYTYYKASYVDAIPMDTFACATGVGRGYRYLPPDSPYVLLPAFHGLSYTNFTISSSSAPRTLHLTPSTSSQPAPLQFAVAVKNVGTVAGTETIFAFFRPAERMSVNPASPTLLPLQRRLCGLAKVAVRPPLPQPSPPKSSFRHAGAHSDRFVKTDDDPAQVEPGAQVTAMVSVEVRALGLTDAAGTLAAVPGAYTVILSTGTQGAQEITVSLTLTGQKWVLDTLPAGI
eukprot:SAG25_NODE_368_length_9082_cov_5.789937_10_plen_233_part_00